ncbi:MAG: TldD/PmbA family protein [Candidatus Latescibacteria bacterium]|nr:TldD/PmbA family protein [Candidatus Latescibacterota bacterium]
MPQKTSRYGLTESETRALCSRVLGLSKADHARVQILSGWRGFTRTATNRVTTAGGSEDISVQITSGFGKRLASLRTNSLDQAGLETAVRKSEDMARISPENPEYMDELGPQQYDTVAGYYDSTGDLSPDARASAMNYAIEQARLTDTVAAGYMDVRAGSMALATTNDLFAYHSSTGVASTLTARTPEGKSSGWAGDQGSDWRNIENERIGIDAVRKCLEWRSSSALDPGKYTVVLEPTAVGMLMSRMLGAFDARRADEGRSFFSGTEVGENRIGEHLFDSRVSLVSDPSSRDAETAPFSGEGLPARSEVWVDKGVLRNLNYSRFWAERSDTASKPRPSNLLMLGGSDSTSDMIRSIRRGVLITRFWYIRGLNPRTISYTGLTRDGTFLIENGKVSRPVNNFRFNQSLAELLQNVEMLGRSVQVCASENSSVSTPIVAPALKVRDFNLSSVSDAI